jgi:hypothetical protein
MKNQPQTHAHHLEVGCLGLLFGLEPDERVLQAVTRFLVLENLAINDLNIRALTASAPLAHTR